MNLVWGIKGTLHSACGTKSKKVVQWDVWKNVTVSGSTQGLMHPEVSITTKDGTVFNKILPEWYLIEN